MKQIIIVFVLILTGVSALKGTAQDDGLKIGSKAPGFRVTSGGSSEFSLSAAKNKILILFYETRGIARSQKNETCKKQLIDYIDSNSNLKPEVKTIYVVKATSVIWPITLIWKSKLTEKADQLNRAIFGDWNGSLFKAYRMKDNESNLYLIDQKGIIRFYGHGVMGKNEIEDIKKKVVQLREDR